VLSYVYSKLRAVDPLKNDDSIPVRANSKKGLKSKKEAREEVQEKVTKALMEIAVKYGFISGKWCVSTAGTLLRPDAIARLVFTEGRNVDSTFRKLAESLVSGPLAETSVTAVRCTTTPLSTVDGQESRYSITVHFPNAYDADEVRSVRLARLPATARDRDTVLLQLMKHLLRRHGLKLTGVKPDIYSLIRESSKSPRQWHMIDEMGHGRTR
jgi:hypothetical protein